MTRDEAIEAGARALWDGTREDLRAPYEWDGVADVRKHVWRSRAAAVLDAIGWAEPVGYLAAEPGALIGAYPTQAEAARSGWGQGVYAVVPVEAE